MRKLIADEFVTLDGVMQGPGGETEDTSGGFAHGGWHMRYMDERAGQAITKGITEAGGFVLGRRTYEIFASYWPTAPDDVQAIAEPLNAKPKFVASTTLADPLDWENSTVLQGDLAAAVSSLKREPGADLHVIGSGRLVQTLVGQGLVDELRLMIDPVVVGGGKRLFADDGVLRSLRLADSWTTSRGTIVATYVADGG
jgi:dihydrofolate reductase